MLNIHLHRHLVHTMIPMMTTGLQLYPRAVTDLAGRNEAEKTTSTRTFTEILTINHTMMISTTTSTSR